MAEMYIPRDELLKASNGSIYGLTVLLAKRALQLADGEDALNDNPGMKVLDNAFREVFEGKVKVKAEKS